MSRSADEVYEIVTKEARGPKKWLRFALALGWGAFTMGSGYTNPGGMRLLVVRKDNGEELCRFEESWADDEGELLQGIERDLASMTVADFEARWRDEGDAT